METVKLSKRKLKISKAKSEEIIKDEEVVEDPKVDDLEGKTLADIGGGTQEEVEPEAEQGSPPTTPAFPNIPSLGGKNIGVVEEKESQVETVEEKAEEKEVEQVKIAPVKDPEVEVETEEKVEVVTPKSKSLNIPSLGAQEPTSEVSKPATSEKPIARLSIADLAKQEAEAEVEAAKKPVAIPKSTPDKNDPIPKKKKNIKKIILPIVFATVSISVAVGAAYYKVNNKDNTSCDYNDSTYVDGSSFDALDGCNICNCTNGEVVCGTDSCADEPVETKSESSESSAPVEIEYVTTVEKNTLYIGTLNTKHVLYYFSESCKNADDTYTKGSYAQILDNETYFNNSCVLPDDMSEIYEVMQLDEDYINDIKSYYYNADLNNVYISLTKSAKEDAESTGIAPYIYEIDLDSQTSKILWELQVEENVVNTSYGYISNKSTKDILIFTLLNCDDCTKEEPDSVFAIDLNSDAEVTVKELGQVYVEGIDQGTISYKKYDNQFFYPIDNLDAKTFYCYNNPDYWCGDGESVWELYSKTYTTSF